MRSLVLLVLAPMLSQARVCGANEAQAPVAPAVSATVTVDAPPAAIAIAKHGGQVVVVDDVEVELLVKGDGEVVAYPVQAQASRPATLRADAQVTVDVPVESGGTRPVNLVWVPADARFVGRVEGARVVTTRPADVNVTVVSQGRRRHRRVERVVVVPAATVVVAQPRAVVVAPPPPAADVRVRGPGAAVAVTGPAASVRVQVPTVDVRIGGPAVAVRVDDGRGPRGDRPNHKHRDRGRHRGHEFGRGNPHGGMR